MATQVEMIIDAANERLGKTTDPDTGEAYFSGGMTYCQRFVRCCYSQAGITGKGCNSATDAYNYYCIQKRTGKASEDTTIPVGACVYFSSTVADGHVGIYAGNGKMFHVWSSKSGISLDSVDKPKGYRGWGWYGFENGAAPSGAGLTPKIDNSQNWSYYQNEPTDTEKQQIKEEIEKQLKELNDMGVSAEVSETGIDMNFSANLQDYTKYNQVHKLKGIQCHPNEMRAIDFKQDYVVIVRKKLYFAATMESEENYLRMYQLNTFTSININSTVNGIGKCTISLKGAERVVCVNKVDQSDKNWQSWEHILNGFTNIDDEGETDGNKWRIGTADWESPNAEGVDYKNLMKAKEAKYGWRFAEKCDIEPMDEVTVFSKSRQERNENGQFKFKKVFFGYINSVKKQFDMNGSMITIEAEDQLKLLKNSYVNKCPSYQPGRFNGGKVDIRFNTDKYGAISLYEPFAAVLANYGSASKEQQEQMATLFTYEEIFAGIYPDILIKKLCSEAGIPSRYLNTRIEPVKVVPYIFNYKSGINYESAEFQSRIQYCQDIAEKCFMEFYQDEEGNIVFKIPNYVVGSNKLTPNNCGYEINEEYIKNIGLPVDTTIKIEQIQALCTLVTPIVYQCTEKDTLRNISKQFFGNEKYASEIKVLNLGNLQAYTIDQNLKKMNLLILKHDTSDAKARLEYRRLMEHQKIGEFTNQLYQKDKGINTTTLLTMAMQTDMFINELSPNEIISFTMSDDDKDIYNSVEVNGQTYMSIYEKNSALAIKRTAAQFDSILRFGVRVAPSISTPFIYDEQSAELFANLTLLKSAAGRYTMTLDMVETPDIHVGDPIRLFTFDEHPQKPTGIWDENLVPSQSIYYINNISRSIKADGVSTMKLSLVAGRMMGQESIYDNMIVLYKNFYQDSPDLEKARQVWEQMADEAWNSLQGSGNRGGSDTVEDTGENETTIYNYLTGTMKYNCAGACGALANIWAESRFLTTADNGSHKGICQWDSSIRYPRIQQYLQGQGLSIDTLSGQLQGMNWELQNYYKEVYNKMSQVANTENGSYDAMYIWLKDYEGPGNIEKEAETRGQKAKEYFNKYRKLIGT